MVRGIYILANDRVMEQAIALLKSIRLLDAETPIVMIPYNQDYTTFAETLAPTYNVSIFDDQDFFNRLSNLVEQVCGPEFFDRPNLLRKLACWFGPLDEFLYIDTDIVVFEKIIDTLNDLDTQDFLCCDYQHLGGIDQVFTSKISEVFSEVETQDVFNSGFWGSRKGTLSWQHLQDAFTYIASHPDSFYLLNSDQTVLNYLVLKHMPRRLNLIRYPAKRPGNWAGSKHFQQQGFRLIDPKLNQPLQFLHWAGIRIAPGCPYWDIWEHYRYLNELKPERSPTAPAPSPNLLQKAVRKFKQVFQ